jgi:hypothetical protein
LSKKRSDARQFVDISTERRQGTFLRSEEFREGVALLK